MSPLVGRLVILGFGDIVDCGVVDKDTDGVICVDEDSMDDDGVDSRDVKLVVRTGVVDGV